MGSAVLSAIFVIFVCLCSAAQGANYGSQYRNYGSWNHRPAYYSNANVKYLSPNLGTKGYKGSHGMFNGGHSMPPFYNAGFKGYGNSWNSGGLYVNPTPYFPTYGSFGSFQKDRVGGFLKNNWPWMAAGAAATYLLLRN